MLDARYRPQDVRRIRALIDEGRAEAGRTDPHETVVYLLAATGTDASVRLAAELREWCLEPGAGIGASGNAAEIAVVLNDIVEAGADSVIIVPTEDQPDPAGFARFIAEEIRPLVR